MIHRPKHLNSISLISKLSLATIRFGKKVYILPNVVNQPSLDFLPEPENLTILDKLKALKMKPGATFDRAETDI